LNGVKSPYFLRYFTEFDSFAGQLRHSVWRETHMSAEYRLPVIFDQNCQTL